MDTSSSSTIQMYKCPRCFDYFHGLNKDAHQCKLFAISYRMTIDKSWRSEAPVFPNDWSVFKVWSVNIRQATEAVLTDLFFRDGRSQSGESLIVQMMFKGKTYTGRARMKYDSNIKLEKNK